MMEIGPWRVDGKGGLKTVQGGWEEYATVVFGESLTVSYAHGYFGSNIIAVDQPAGTGFSYAPSNRYDHELPEVSLPSAASNVLRSDYHRLLRTL